MLPSAGAACRCPPAAGIPRARAGRRRAAGRYSPGYCFASSYTPRDPPPATLLELGALLPRVPVAVQLHRRRWHLPLTEEEGAEAAGADSEAEASPRAAIPPLPILDEWLLSAEGSWPPELRAWWRVETPAEALRAAAALRLWYDEDPRLLRAADWLEGAVARGAWFFYYTWT